MIVNLVFLALDWYKQNTRKAKVKILEVVDDRHLKDLPIFYILIVHHGID